MSSLLLLGLLVLLLTVAGLAVVYLRGGRPMPGRRRFQCAHCATATVHNARTLEAWRNGKAKFFCDRCHGEWATSHSAPPMAYQLDAPRRGCLGSVAALVLLPGLLLVGYWLI